MGVFMFISIFILSYIASGFFNISITSLDNYINFEFSIIIATSYLLVTTIYCYAVPYLYVKGKGLMRAFIHAPKILLKFKNKSKPIILLLFIMFLIIILQLNNKGDLWLLATLGAVINSCIYFIVFLTACQILDEIDILQL